MEDPCLIDIVGMGRCEYRLDVVDQEAVCGSRMRHSGEVPKGFLLQRALYDLRRVESGPAMKATALVFRTENIEKLVVGCQEGCFFLGSAVSEEVICYMSAEPELRLVHFYWE